LPAVSRADRAHGRPSAAETRKGDGLRQVRNSTVQAVRGGAFDTIAFNGRSAERNSVTP